MSHQTRRFELGLPLFAGLDLGLLMESQAQIERGEFKGLTTFISTLGRTAELKAIRKLSAIWKATDIELKAAEADPRIMAQMEDLAAEKPFGETFKDAMDFQFALWESFGVTPVFSAPAVAKKDKAKSRKTSVGSPSES